MRTHDGPGALGGATAAATAICAWCGKRFSPRSSGGRPQRFCRPACRRVCHEAARTWALAELAAGRLTVADLRNAPPTTCALVGGARATSEAPEAQPPAEAAAGRRDRPPLDPARRDAAAARIDDIDGQPIGTRPRAPSAFK
jgi:hypothetical protein